MKKLVLATLTALTMSSNAHAFGILTGFQYAAAPGAPIDPVATVLCIAVLPLCILDEKAASSSVTAQDLLDNGYKAAEVESILQGQAALVNHLRANNQAIVNEGPLSKGQVVQYLKTVNGMTEGYVQFFKAN